MELSFLYATPRRQLQRQMLSRDFAEVVAYERLYGLPEGRADVRAAIVARFAGMPHKLGPRDLLARDWAPLLRPEPRKKERKQTPQDMMRVMRLAIQGQTGRAPQEA